MSLNDTRTYLGSAPFSLSLSLSTAELNVELSRPLKISPTLVKLEQAKSYLEKILPQNPASASSTPHSSPMKTPHRSFPAHSDPRHHAALSFHKVTLSTAQIVVAMETETHPLRPSLCVSLSAMTGAVNVKSEPRSEGEYRQV